MARVLWIALALAAPATGITRTASSRKHQSAITRKGLGINDPPQLQESATMGTPFRPYDEEDTEISIPEFHSCPGDSVAKNHDIVRPLLNQHQRDLVDKAASLVHIANPVDNLNLGCAFKMASADRQLMLDSMQTWAKKCDKIFAFTNETWQLPGPWDVTMVRTSIAGGDNYTNVWQKTQAMMGYLESIWEKEGFDFVVMSDTDTFFVMENLRDFLSSTEIQRRHAAGGPVLLGDLYADPDDAWVSGGGYVINRQVVKAVISCDTKLKEWVTHADDVLLSRCLRSGPFHYNLLHDGPACDSDAKDRFNHLSISQLNVRDLSSRLVMFHHTLGEERYRFYQELYGDRSPRVCADMPVRTLVRKEQTQEHLEEDDTFNKTRIALMKRAYPNGRASGMHVLC